MFDKVNIRRRLIIFWGAVCVVAGLYLWVIIDPSVLPETRPVGVSDPPISITADELLVAYNTNEVRAEGVFGGKTLVVRGLVDRVSISLGTPVLLLKSTTHNRVQCHFDKKDSVVLAQLDPGQLVRVRGRCVGKSINVSLADCSREW